MSRDIIFRAISLFGFGQATRFGLSTQSPLHSYCPCWPLPPGRAVTQRLQMLGGDRERLDLVGPGGQPMQDLRDQRRRDPLEKDQPVLLAKWGRTKRASDRIAGLGESVGRQVSGRRDYDRPGALLAERIDGRLVRGCRELVLRRALAEDLGRGGEPLPPTSFRGRASTRSRVISRNRAWRSA